MPKMDTLYYKALKWLESPAPAYYVDVITLDNVIRLLCKTGSILLSGISFRITGRNVVVVYGSKTASVRLVDAIYVIDKLLPYYILVQQEANLPTIVPDIQRKIFLEGESTKAARYVTKTTNKATQQLVLQQLCNQPITFQELTRYILETNPEVIVMHVISDNIVIDEWGIINFEYYGFTRLLVPTLDTKLQEKYKSTTMPTYTRSQLKLYSSTEYKLLDHSSNHDLNATGTTVKNNIISYMEHNYKRDNYVLDLYTIKKILLRRLSCVKANPQYADTHIQQIIQQQKDNINPAYITSYIHHYMYLVTSLLASGPILENGSISANKKDYPIMVEAEAAISSGSIVRLREIIQRLEDSIVNRLLTI